MASRKDVEKAAWFCRSCKSSGKAWRNSGTASACSKCKVAKGSCFGSKDVPARPSASSTELRELAKVRREKQQLEAALAKLKEASAGPAPAADAVDEDLATGDASNARARELRLEIAQHKGDIAFYEGLEEGRKERVCAPLGGAMAVIKALNEKLQACYASLRGCRSVSSQLHSAQQHENKMAKQLEVDQAKLDESRGQLAKLQADIIVQEAAAESTRLLLVSARSEVSTLAVLRAAESVAAGAGAAGTPSGPPAQTAPNGFVALADAERLWAERETAFTAQLASLQALVAGRLADTSSEISEPVDDIDIDGDDDAWEGVGKSQRKQVVSKHRKLLAARVATTINKTSRVASPFCKGGGPA